MVTTDFKMQIMLLCFTKELYGSLIISLRKRPVYYVIRLFAIVTAGTCN